MSSVNSQTAIPFAYIVEQPAKCGVRFRYECERRSSVIRGARPGTFPTVAVAHYQGPIKVVVSCVTKDPPYRAHPHSVDSIGGGVPKFYPENSSLGTSAGISVAHFSEPTAVFSQLGVLYAKRNAVKEALRRRERLGVDPFGAGFAHRNLFQKLIDFGALRLCFQVYIRSENDEHDEHYQQESFSGRRPGQWTPLEPIVSEPIYDRKLRSELAIVRLSHDSAPVSGGLVAVLLCERVAKEDIEVRFFQLSSSEEEENFEKEVLWERLALFTPNEIHKNVAIVFTVPPFDGHFQQQTTEGGNGLIPVQVQLRRPSDGCTSEPVPFYYYHHHHQQDVSSVDNITTMDTQQFEAYDHQQQQHNYFLDNLDEACQCTEQLSITATSWPFTENFSEEFLLSL